MPDHPDSFDRSDELDPLDLTSMRSVVEWLRAGARANRDAKCRAASVDIISGPGRLIATGDLHDNPMHLQALLRAANLQNTSAAHQSSPEHLVLHELIHGDRLINKMDFSYRTLAQAARLKVQFPEFVHLLLGNHELAQFKGSGILKDGVRCVEAFNAGVEYVFGADAPQVHDAIRDFVTSMPIALRCRTPRGDIIVAHSLPPPHAIDTFDHSILSRPLVESDYEPRTGAAHVMVWGRGHDAATLRKLLDRFGASMFILGHEKVDEGARYLEPDTIVLNSDHIGGAYLPIDLDHPKSPSDAVADAIKLLDVIAGE
jgi:hypothetical protein